VGDRIEVVARLDPDAGRVAMSPSQLGQVIMNLVVNARDAMPHGGQLTIETLRAGSEAVLAVIDTGIGMDTATRERLFEPYFTTKEPGKGTGLGLSTVRDVVRQAGGRIEVSSEVGRGSTFTIHLPRADDETQLTERPPALPARTVLVVEDEPEVRELIREVLQFEKYTVLEAAEGEGALTLVEGHEGPIDLLITDIVLPGTAGDELAQSVVAARPGIKVIYVSGYLEADDPAPARRFGPLLSKPFTIATLIRTVHDVLNGTG
jgi:two-component system, cell cycle sensor histidine kinase and response regulator CckA